MNITKLSKTFDHSLSGIFQGFRNPQIDAIFHILIGSCYGNFTYQQVGY